MPTTVEIPMELDMVDPTNANAYWTSVNGPIWAEGRYRFARSGNPGPIAGRGLMTFKTNVPKNLAGTPAWNLVLHHKSNSSTGAVLLRVEGEVSASGESQAGMTILVPNQLFGVGASGDLNVTTLSGTNFDSLLALTAGDKLEVRVMRMPDGPSGDSVTGDWDLCYPPLLRVDVA